MHKAVQSQFPLLLSSKIVRHLQEQSRLQCVRLQRSHVQEAHAPLTALRFTMESQSTARHTYNSAKVWYEKHPDKRDKKTMRLHLLNAENVENWQKEVPYLIRDGVLQ